MRSFGVSLVARHAAAALVVLSMVACDAATPPAATVEQGWFRSLPGALPAAGYFVLHNAGDKPLALSGADSPACASIMLHKSE